MRLELDVKLLDSLLKDVYGDNAFAVVNVCEETGLYRLRLFYDGKYFEYETETLEIVDVLIDFLATAKVEKHLKETCRKVLLGF